jgi:hypothetical protein
VVYYSDSQPSLDEDALRYAVRGVSEASKDGIIAELRQHFKELVQQEYQITTNSPSNEFLAELSLSPIRTPVSDKKRALEGASEVQPSQKKFKASASAPNETTSDSELEEKAPSQESNENEMDTPKSESEGSSAMVLEGENNA